MDIAQGQRLSHFDLLEEIGHGGMGVVWRALDADLGREVAIKVLPEAKRHDPQLLQRFKREARAVAALNHPNIVTVHSVEQDREHHFLVMELIRGETLAELIATGGLLPDRFFEIAIPMTDAIRAAHEGGITHNDLKPRNVMIDASQRVKVLDFGLARFREPAKAVRTPEDTPLGSDEDTLTIEGRITGTMPYMSPEQLQRRPLDHRTDVFALGIILYEMATGRRPFRGESPADVIASVLRESPPPIDELNPDYPRPLWRIVRHCLEKDPDRRFQTARDLFNELEDMRREEASAHGMISRSIGVLPFADMSPERDQDYFCEGIAEEIINALSRIRDLRVVSRTSAFQFKDREFSSREIGRRLDVGCLLSGSVRKASGRLRITAELIDVVEDRHLWSDRFDRTTEDIFEIQDEISGNVVRALRLVLSPEERSDLGRAPTADAEAYDLYMRGRNFYYQYRRQGIEFALQMFTRAIERDPAYARAYAGIADCCSYLFVVAGTEERHREQAEAASLRALELGPELAQAHASRGVALSLQRRFEEAEQAFETAIRLDPRLFEAYYFYARDSFAQGKLEKAARLYEQASAVRPDDYQSSLLVAQIYDELKRPADAERVRRRGVRAAETRLALSPDDARALYMGANGLVGLGENERGMEWADRAVALDPEEPMTLYNVACIKAMAGQIEPAVECVERAIAAGLTDVDWIRHDNNLDRIRDHPRVQEMLRQLPER